MVNDNNDRRSKLQRNCCFIIFSIIFIIVIAVRIRLLNVPLERDEGEYAYIGQLLLQGKLPYLHAYTMKLPGTHAAYALIMVLFGQTMAGIHFGLLLINAITTLLVYVLARRLAGTIAAATAGTVFAIMTLSNTVLGTFAHATHFVILCVVGGLILILRGIERQRLVTLFSGGLIFGLAYTMKQHGIFFSAIPLLLLTTSPVGPAINPGSRLRNCLVFLSGLVLPLAVITLTLSLAGGFDKLLFWTVQYAKAYTETVPLDWGWRVFLNQFTDVTRNTGIFWFLAGAGLTGMFFSPRTKGYRLLLSALTLCSMAAILPGLHFRPHYFIQALPAVALLAGISVETLPSLLPRRATVAARWLLIALIISTSGRIFYGERDLLFRLSPEEVIKKSYQTAKPFAESVAVAEFIKANSSPSDKILVIGSEPQIYFYSQRPAGTGYIYLYGLLENQPYAELMQNEYLREMAASSPRFIVIVNDIASWMSDGISVEPFLNKANHFMQERYYQVGVIDIHRNEPSRFVWGKGATLYSPQSSSYILVLAKKQ